MLRALWRASLLHAATPLTLAQYKADDPSAYNNNCDLNNIILLRSLQVNFKYKAADSSDNEPNLIKS